MDTQTLREWLASRMNQPANSRGIAMGQPQPSYPIPNEDPTLAHQQSREPSRLTQSLQAALLNTDALQQLNEPANPYRYDLPPTMEGHPGFAPPSAPLPALEALRPATSPLPSGPPQQSATGPDPVLGMYSDASAQQSAPPWTPPPAQPSQIPALLRQALNVIGFPQQSAQASAPLPQPPLGTKEGKDYTFLNIQAPPQPEPSAPPPFPFPPLRQPPPTIQLPIPSGYHAISPSLQDQPAIRPVTNPIQFPPNPVPMASSAPLPPQPPPRPPPSQPAAPSTPELRAAPVAPAPSAPIPQVTQPSKPPPAPALGDYMPEALKEQLLAEAARIVQERKTGRGVSVGIE